MSSIRALAVPAALAMLLSASPAAAAAKLPAPQFSDPNIAGARLVNDFFVLLQNKDSAKLQRFLAPAFQVQRADGSAAGKAEYLASLPTVSAFTITKLVATQT